ncbi:MAG: methyltransferase [Smithella sp.]|nr:methyltransferase [Smithella sp.]
MDEETLDEILNGLVRVYQKKKGYRFSIDSILLAHFVSLKKRSRFMDIGCGSGVILMILAKRFPDTTCVGLEVQESLAKLARKNVEFNDLGNRIQIVRGDARHIKNIFQERSFDSVIFNPPYRKFNSGRVNPLPEKAIARHEITGSLDCFLKASRYLLKPGGTVFTIFPAMRLVELIHLFRKNGIEPKRMKLVFSDLISEAEFCLVEGRMGGREQLKILPSLLIYNDRRRYSDDMMNIFSELSGFRSDGDG